MIELGTGDVAQATFSIFIKKERGYELKQFGEATLGEIFVAIGLLGFYSNKETKPLFLVPKDDHDQESLLKLAQEISTLDQENYEEKGE